MPTLHFALLLAFVLIASGVTVWLFNIGGIALGAAILLCLFAVVALRALRR